MAEDKASEKHWLDFALEMGKPCVMGVADTFHQLKEESFLMVDPLKVVIYKEG